MKISRKILGGYLAIQGIVMIALVFDKDIRSNIPTIIMCLAFGILFIYLSYLCFTYEKRKEIKEQKLKEQQLQNQIRLDEMRLDSEISNKTTEIKQKQNIIEELKAEIQSLKEEKNFLNEELIYEYQDNLDYSDITSEEIKNELSLLQLKIKNLYDDKKAYNVLINNKNTPNQLKQIVKCFSVEFNELIRKLKLNNVDSIRNRLMKSYESINKLFHVDGVEISKDLLELKLQELAINHKLILKIEQEKEDRREEKERLIEEEKVRREIEQAKKKIDKEEHHFKNEISKLMKYLNSSTTDVEKNLYIEKIKELEENLNKLEKDKEDVLNREQNTRAGYVYIISNIGSFGENIYKIGMTRRLEPLDRIKELSSASVPFEFDVHALIFSDDAPALENILHSHFKNNAVNLMNYRKEFYNVNLQDIKKIVLENYNNTVDFVLDAPALQYRESIKLRKNL